MSLFKREVEKFRLNPEGYLSSFYLDLVAIFALTLGVQEMRKLELEALVQMGIFKDLDEMNDRELFTEYDKMIK